MSAVFPIAPHSARVDDDAARSMAMVLAEAIGASVSPGRLVAPFIYPMRVVAETASAAIGNHLSLADGLIAIHESQSILCERPLPLAGEMSVDGELHVVTGAAISVSLHARSIAAEPIFAAMTRVRLTSAAAVVASLSTARTRPVEHTAALSLVSETLTPELVCAYAQAAADFNPIHTDEGFVRSLGLPERVVPGMLMAGLAEPALARWGYGRLAELRTRFLAPCFVGERVSLTLSEAQAAPSATRRFRVIVARQQGPVVCISDVGLADS